MLACLMSLRALLAKAITFKYEQALCFLILYVLFIAIELGLLLWVKDFDNWLVFGFFFVFATEGILTCLLPVTH